MSVLTSCGGGNNPPVVSDADMDSGVVLIEAAGYYALDFGKVVKEFGFAVYVDNPEADEPDFVITDNRDSIPIRGWSGTGFFISEDGFVATNAHVTGEPLASQVANIQQHWKVFVNALLASLEEDRIDLETAKTDAHINAYGSSTRSQLRAAINEHASIDEQLKEIAYTKSLLQSTLNVEPNLTFVPLFIGYVLNGNRFSGTSDLTNLSTVVADIEHDVAILQANNKKTPEDCYVFDVPDEDSTVEIFKGDAVYSIGFNYGEQLAETAHGIENQRNDGRIQKIDDDDLMYSIPILPGSSGSPVMDEEGNLIAINRAGYRFSGNYNIGAKVKYLRVLMDKAESMR